MFAWILFSIYLILTTGLAIVGMKKTSTLAGFAIGNRDMSPALVGITLASSVASSATFVVNPGFVYTSGLSALLHFGLAATSGVTVGLIVLSKGFRQHGDRTAALTLPHWLGARYNNGLIRTFFAILNLLLAITFVVLIIKGSALVMQSTLGLGYTGAVLLIVGFVFSYIMLGGTYAHAYTNALQGGMMIIVAILIVGSGFHLLGDGLGAFGEKLAAQDPNLVEPFNPTSGIFTNAWEVLFAPFIIGIGLVCQPHILTKSLYLRSEKDVNRYLVFGAVIGFIFAAILLAGLYARVQFPDIPSQDAVMATYIAKAFPEWLAAPVSVALLAAGMSTMDGILVSASTIAGNDIFLGWLGERLMPNKSQEEREVSALKASRYILVGMGVIALVISLNPPGLVGLFAQFGVYGVVASSLAPLAMGIFVPSITGRDALFAAVGGIGSHLVFYLIAITAFDKTWTQVNPASSAAVGVAVSFVLMFASRALRKDTPTAASDAA